MKGFRDSFVKANPDKVMKMVYGNQSDDSRVNRQGLIQLSKNQRNECRNEGCHNEKQLGSSRCGECKDKYHAER